MKLITVFLCNCALVLCSSVMWAATIILPTATEGNGNNATPFGLGSPYFAPQITGRYQQVYNAGAFSSFGARTITELAFRLDQIVSSDPGSSTLGNVVVALAITAKNADGLDPMFANNLPGSVTTVYSGPLTFSWSASSGPQRPFDFRIPLQQAFLYDPSVGNLLLDISVKGGNTLGSSTPVFDAANAADSVSRVRANSSAPDGWQLTSGTADTFGLVTEFTATPEPSTIALAAFGLMGLAVWGWRRRKR